MDDNNDNIFDPNIPLILTDAITISNNNEKDLETERFKINKLIQKKFLINDIFIRTKEKNNLDKNFLNIKLKVQKINNDTKKEQLLITENIHDQKEELKQLYFKKNLLNRNEIQNDIINNTKKLIESYKDNSNDLKFNLDEVKKKLNKKILFSQSLEVRNQELKNTVNNYVINNKKLEDKIMELDKNQLNGTLLDELNVKVKLFQEENVRLSSEITIIQKKYETIKENFAKEQSDKNNIYKQIQELNDSLIKNNILGTPYQKEIINDDSINSKVLNEISNTNFQEENKAKEKIKNLDDKISDIFE